MPVSDMQLLTECHKFHKMTGDMEKQVLGSENGFPIIYTLNKMLVEGGQICLKNESFPSQFLSWQIPAENV